MELTQHQCRNSDGELLATLWESHAPEGPSRFEFCDRSGRLVLTAIVSGPGATQVLVGASRKQPFAGEGSTSTHPGALNSGIQQVGDGTVMLSLDLEDHPSRVIDDYQNRTRHFIFGCSPNLFLHVNLDAHGTIMLTEKTRDHATLRIVHRDQTGRVFADAAIAQAGESLAEIALRCGVPLAALVSLNPAVSRSAPPAGATLQLA